MEKKFLKDFYFIENFQVWSEDRIPEIAYYPRLANIAGISLEEVMQYSEEKKNAYFDDLEYSEPVTLIAGDYELENQDQAAIFSINENGCFHGWVSVIENSEPLFALEKRIENNKVVEIKKVHIPTGNYEARIIFESDKIMRFYFDVARGVIQNAAEQFLHLPEGENEVLYQYDENGVKMSEYNQILKKETHFYPNGKIKFWINFETNEGAQYDENGALIYEDILVDGELIRRID